MGVVLEAVFQDGVFRPTAPPGLPDGQVVRLLVEPRVDVSAEEMLASASRVYAGLTPDDIRDVEAIALNRHDFFGRGLR